MSLETEKNWLWTWLCPLGSPRVNYRRFTYIEFEEDATKRSEVEILLAQMLRDYHTYSDVDQNLFRQLGYPRLAATLAGDQRPNDHRTRMGNFMEILAYELAKASGYDLPVLRLRYNPNPEQSMKGDDILGFRFAQEGKERDTVLVGEAKFRKEYKKRAVEEAYEALTRSFRPYPRSMEFVRTILSLRGDIATADKVDLLRRKLASNPESVERKYMLIMGTVGRHPDPFRYLDELNEIRTGVIAAYVVFQEEFTSWLEQAYECRG